MVVRLAVAMFILSGLATLGFSKRVGHTLKEIVETPESHTVISRHSWINDPKVRNARSHYVSLKIKSNNEDYDECTGVLWQTGLVLTNFHAITRFSDEADDVTIYDLQTLIDADEGGGAETGELLTGIKILVNGKPARIVFEDRKKDLLLLSVKTIKVAKVKTRARVELEEPVFYIGNPGEYTGFVSGGAVVYIKKGLIKNTTFSERGMSGSGVYSAIDGKLLGIQVAGYDKKYRLSVARDIAEIVTFLKEAQKKTKIKIII